MEFMIGDIEIQGKMILAPMDGYTSQPFRVFTRLLGSSVSISEFIGALDIFQNHPHLNEKLSFSNTERPFAYQIFDNDPDRIVFAAQNLAHRLPDFFDLNLGCSARHVSSRGAGAGLLRYPEKVSEIIELLVKNLNVPVTAKIRLGWDETSKNFVEIAKRIEQAGGKALAVHARTRSQGYKGNADWKAIEEIKKNVHIPVIGNGDIKTIEDVDRMLDTTGCDAVMIGRSALSNPWIFSRTNRENVGESIFIESVSNLLILMQEFYGTDRGIIFSRKFLSRFIAPYQVNPDIRKELLTSLDRSSIMEMIQEIIVNSTLTLPMNDRSASQSQT